MHKKQERRCVACRQNKQQNEMIRIARINQEFVIDTFFATLCACKEKNYTAAVFSAIGKDMKSLINHYASMYKYNGVYKNLWQNSKFDHYAPLLMSEKAYHIFSNNKDSYQKYKASHKENTDELLYWEHITPNEVVWQRICNVYHRLISANIEESNLKNEVEKCFSNHKLLLLTKTESNKLDEIGGRTGKAIDIIRNSDASINVAAYRIKLLFDEGIINYMYLNKKRLSKNEIVNDNGCFVDKGLSYFTDNSFVI